LRKSLPAIIESNSSYTFDPGGFSFILRLWSEVSSNAVWLRILPELFFFLALIAIFLILKQLKVDHFSSSLTLLLITIGITGNDAAFLRPYSASLCAYVWILYLSIKILIQPIDSQNLFPIILIVATFGIWMRYDAVIWVFGILLSLFYSRKAFIAISIYEWKLALSLLIFFSSGVAIYFLSLQNQLKSTIKMSYHPYIDSQPEFLMTKANLMFIVFLSLLYLIRVNSKSVKSDKKLIFLFNHYAILNLLYLLSSSFGLYPWHPWSHVSAPLPTGLILLTVITLSRFFQKSGALLVRVVIGGAAMTYFAIISHLGLVVDFSGHESGRKLVGYFQDSENSCKGGKFLVDHWDSPTIRFFFEIQRPELIEAFGYPDNFNFLPESSITWDKSKLNDELNIQVLSEYCALIVSAKSGELDLQEWNQIIPNWIWTKM
jgi:hypothetical protein